MNVVQLKQKLRGETACETLGRLYGGVAGEVQREVERYERLLETFVERFPSAARADVTFLTAPGRTEIGGNHTDHNNGRVLAAAVHLDTIAVAAPTRDSIVTVQSEGYGEPFVVDTRDLGRRDAERGNSAALIRGVGSRLHERGRRVGGFQACVTSEVGVGSGLSSSAAFEVLIGAVFNHFHNDGKVGPREIALAGRYAENHFFGKPCGLMDQMTSAVGGFVTIDFADPTNPEVRRVRFDLAASGLSLVVTNTGGDHADLTPEYASVRDEMRAVARALGGEFLGDVSRERLVERLGDLRAQAGDRAILRAFHFFADNERVIKQVAALESDNVERFLALVNESGQSSWMLLQNCYIPGAVEQGVALGLALSESILGRRGAWRVHGGGFAGTILAFVPDELVESYVSGMEATFGKGSARILRVRQSGAARVELE